MNRLEEKFKYHLSSINSSNFSGAMDIIVIQREDASLHSTSFFVQFGILDLFKTKDRRVDIEVNGVLIQDIEMRLLETGVAYFHQNLQQMPLMPQIQVNSKVLTESDKKLNANGLTETQNNLLKFNLNTLDAYFKASNILEKALDKTNLKKQEPSRIRSYPKKYSSFKSIDSEPDSVTSKSDSSTSNCSVEECVEGCVEADVKKPNSILTPITATRRATSLKDRYELFKIKTSKPDSVLSISEIDGDIYSNYYSTDSNQNQKNKTSILSSDQLKTFKLNYGINKIQYSVRALETKDVTSSDKKSKKLFANIFLWNYSDKIVISDIDGTITKSDIRGQILTLFGQQWYHDNIASLFAAIEERKYKIIYLSARSICQIDTTRNLIRSISQNGCSMPKGPMILNPNQLFSAIQNEVVANKIDEKLVSLEQVKSLFGPEKNPFHAGFGNKLNDASVYKNVNIDSQLIFIIKSNGEINDGLMGTDLKLSYTSLLDKIGEYFP